MNKLVKKFFYRKTSKKENRNLDEQHNLNNINKNINSVISKKSKDIKNIHPKISFIIIAIALIGIVFATSKNKDKKNLGTFNNPEVAFEECKKNLTEISEIINKNNTNIILNQNTNE